MEIYNDSSDDRLNSSTGKFGWVDNFLKTVLNLAYYLCASPLRITNDNPDKSSSNICSAGMRKWAAYIVKLFSLLTAIFACISTSSAISRASIRSPSIIFLIAPDIGDCFLCFMFWYVVWTRQKDIKSHFALLALRTPEKWRKIKPHQPFDKTGTGATKLCCFGENFGVHLICYIMVSTFQTFDMMKTISRISQPGTNFHSTFLGVFFQEMRRGIWLDDRPGMQFQEMKTYEVILAFIYFFFTSWFKFVKAFAILLCMAGVCVAFKNACEFKQFLMQETSQTKVIQAYQAFQDFIESINRIIGPLIFGIAVVCAPTFFVANLGSILLIWNSDSPITWLTMIIYMFLFLVASEIPVKTDEFREWIFECGQGHYENELFAIFVDLTQNPLGVQGMDCFTLTYGYMAQMMSAVVSFTIILLQFSPPTR